MKNGINAMLFDMSVASAAPDDLQMGSRQPEFQCQTWRLHSTALSTS